jgi:hypothetical protein
MGIYEETSGNVGNLLLSARAGIDSYLLLLSGYEDYKVLLSGLKQETRQGK